MTHTLKAFFFTVILATACHAQTVVEAEFAAQRVRYVTVAGTTDEPSCGGTGLTVFLEGSEIRKLAYSIETSQRIIQRDYYFRGIQLVLVVESRYFLRDDQGERLPKARLEGVTRYVLDGSVAILPEKKEEFDEHSRYLVTYFREHRDGFKTGA